LCDLPSVLRARAVREDQNVVHISRNEIIEKLLQYMVNVALEVLGVSDTDLMKCGNDI